MFTALMNADRRRQYDQDHVASQKSAQFFGARQATVVLQKPLLPVPYSIGSINIDPV